MNKPLLLLPLLFCCALLSAQTVYSGQLEVGFHGVNMGATSRATQSVGYPALKNQYGTVLLGVNTFLGKWAVGGRGCLFMSQDPVEIGHLSLIRYYYGTLHIGRVLVATKGNSFRLYPTAGIGYGTAYLRLDKGTAYSAYYGPGAIADVSLNGSWFWPMAGDPRNSLMVSISGGYTAAFAGWTLKTLVGSPSAAPTGPYIRLGMGMASAKR